MGFSLYTLAGHSTAYEGLNAKPTGGSGVQVSLGAHALFYKRIRVSTEISLRLDGDLTRSGAKMKCKIVIGFVVAVAGVMALSILRCA